MNPDFWGAFHDGHIRKIEGEVPGDVTIHVSVIYLREMFQGSGTGFVVHLNGCTLFEYQEYDESPIADLKAIEEKEPELLYCKPGIPTVVECVMGDLRMAYEEASVSLDTGESVSDAELGEACNSYWEAWKRKNQDGNL